MKVLILTVTAGYGHHATAAAVEDELKSRGATTHVVDVYKSINKLLYDAVDKGYLLSTKYASDVYRTVYSALERKQKSNSYTTVSMINALCAMRFEKLAEFFDPDVVICTHIFAAQIIDELKKREKVKIPAIGIITDYTIHPYWEDVAHIEHVVLASDLLIYRAVKRGIRPECLLPLGIPIKPKFSKNMDKAEARRLLGLHPDRKTILLMGGSMGYGRMSEMVEQLKRMKGDYTMLAVCGNNKRQYNRLIQENGGQAVNGKLHIYGFVDNVDVMMDAADCLVTKPGGLTVSEALAKMLPMVLVSPIPGQEERNIEFLMNNGMALRVTKTFEIDEAVHYIFSNPERLRIMAESIQSVRKPCATSDLADFVMGFGG